VLLQAKQLAINLTYYNALSKDYANRIKIAEEIAESYQKMYDEGTVDILERNQVYMDLLTCVNEKEKIDIEIKSLLDELKALNGGIEIQFDSTVIPLTSLPANFNEWYSEAELNSPALQYLNQKIDISRQQVKLNKALSLPKLSAGFVDERILGEKLQGLTVGVSIPLWENKNTIKQAKADIISSEYSLEDNKLQYYNRLQSLFNKSVNLQSTAVKYRQALSSYNSVPLLRKALKAGEITLLNYLLQIEAYYDAYNSMLEVERDYALAEAELTAVSL
jgi:outer membrane protein TolC